MTVRGTVVVNSGDEMVSAYLVSTYGFDGKHLAISVDVVDRKISDQQGYWISIEKLVNLKELTGTRRTTTKRRCLWQSKIAFMGYSSPTDIST